MTNTVATNTVMVVVDVQKEFFAARYVKEAIAEKIKEVKLPVIIVEYDCERYKCEESPRPPRDTYEEVMQAVEQSPVWTLTVKKTDDGSSEIIEAAHRLGYASPEFLVCGVNTGGCVKDTVYGLLEKYRTVKVLAECCASVSTTSHNNTLEEWESIEILA